MKKISLVLVTVMLFTLVNLPVGAVNPENVIFSENFNDLSTESLRTTYASELTTVNADGSAATDSASYYEVSDGAMALNMKTSHSSITFKKSTGIVSSGKIGLSMKLKPASGVTSKAVLKTNNNAASFFMVLIDKNGTVNLGSSNNNAGTVALDTWLDLSAVLDFESDKAYLMLIDSEGNILSKAVDFDAANIVELDIGQYAKADASMYVDDISIYTIPPVSTDENNVFAENFDNLTTADFVTEALGKSELTSGKTACYSIEDGALNITNSDTNSVAYLKIPAEYPDSGKIGYKFRITPASGATTRAVLKTKNNAGTFFVCCVDTSGNVSLGAASGTDAVLSEGKWCDVTATFDYSGKKVNILFSDEDGKSVTKSVDFVDNQSNEAPNIFGMQFQQWGKSGAVLTVDNIHLYKNASDIPTTEPTLLPVTEDFEGYAENTFLTAGSTGEKYGNYGGTVSGHTTGQKVIASTEDGHGSRVLQYDASVMTDTANIPQYTRTVTGTKDDGKLKNGVVKYSADIKVESEWSFYASIRGMRKDTGAVLGFPVFRFAGGKIYYGAWSNTAANEIGSYSPGAWYHTEVTVDVKAASASLAVTASDGTVYEKTGFSLAVPGAAEATAEYVSDFAINFDKLATLGTSGKILIDNVKIEYISNAPEATDDSLTIYDGETLQEDKTAVSPSSNKLVIDFGAATRLGLASVASGVKLSDANGDVAYNGHLDGNVYTLTLTESLKSNTEYTVSLSENIADINGNKLGKNININFTTSAGEFTAALAGIKKGENNVTALSELAKGDSIATSITVKNTTDSAKKMTLIYCYYSESEEGTLLTRCKISEIDVNAGQDNATITDTHTVDDLTGVSNITVLLWDNFNDIKPLSEAIELK